MFSTNKTLLETFFYEGSSSLEPLSGDTKRFGLKSSVQENLNLSGWPYSSALYDCLQNCLNHLLIGLAVNDFAVYCSFIIGRISTCYLKIDTHEMIH